MFNVLINQQNLRKGSSCGGVCGSAGFYPLIPNKRGDSVSAFGVEASWRHPACSLREEVTSNTKGLESKCGPSERPRLLAQSRAPHLSPARVCIAVAGSLAAGTSRLAWCLHHRLQSQSFDALSFLAFSVSACRLLSRASSRSLPTKGQKEATVEKISTGA